MPKPASPTRLTDRKRAAIIAAAAAQFGTHGFDNTSMDAIAESAGVSKRTVYNHFPSKEDLFAAIVEDLRTRTSVLEMFPYDADRPLAEQLTEIGRTAMELFASDEFQHLARVILPRFLQSPQLAHSMLGEPDEGFRNWIKAARKAGRLNVPHPTTAAKQFLGLLNSVAFWPQIVGGDPPLSKREQKATIQSAVAMFLSHYAA